MLNDQHSFLSKSQQIVALLITADGHVKDLNPCAKRVFGPEKSHYLLEDFFNQQEVVHLLKAADSVLKNLKNINNSNVTERLAYVEYQKIENVEDNLVLLTISKDRYIPKRLEDTSEQELFRSLTQTIPAFLFRFSLSSQGEMAFLYLARGRQTYFLFDEQKISNVDSFLKNNIHPDDLEVFFQSILQSAKTLAPWKHTVRLLANDDTYRWAEGLANPELQPNGDVVWSGVMFDIHELMNTRQMLEEMAIAGDIGYWEFYPATNELVWSAQTKRIHEVPDDYEPDVSTAINFYKEGVNREIINKAFQQALVEGKPFDVECELISYLGKSLWVRAKGKVEFTDGHTLRMFGIFQDITQEMRNRETIRYNQWLYRSSFVNSPVALMQTNDEGKVINANGLAVSMFGHSHEEFLQLTRYELFCNEENELTEYIEQRRITGERKAILTGLRKDGTTFPVEVLSLIFQDIEGKVLINKALVDLTDQYRIERLVQEKSNALDRIFNESIDAICSCDLNGVFLSMSRSSLQNWGYEPEEMIGQSFLEFVFPEDRAISMDIFQRINQGFEVRNFKNRYLHKNGTTVITEWSARFDALTRQVYAIGRDVTELHQIQSEKEMLIRELISSNQDLRQFTYITSHNLRAPIANLIGLLELLDYEPESKEELNEIYQGLKKTGAQINQTISDLNEILVIRDKAQAEKEWLNLPEMLERVLQQVSLALEKADVSWHFDFHPCSKLWFNRTYLESIMLNLVTNSIKYRSNKRPLELRVGMTETAKEHIVTFNDNGMGLDTARYSDRLFGLYQRFHNNADSKGLGLYLVKTQMEALGGRIEAEGQEDQGLTIRLCFPRNEA